VTATTATASAATTEASATAATTATAALALFGLINLEGTAIDDCAIHGLNRLLRALRRAHRDERKAAGAARVAIRHNVDIRDLIVRGKLRTKGLGRGVKREVSNIKTLSHDHDLLLTAKTVLEIGRAVACDRVGHDRMTVTPHAA
jgi:hypothetical protein